MLKADFHVHTDEYKDGTTPKDVIKYAAKCKYDVLAITNHGYDGVYNRYKHYAKKLGVLLIPGIELNYGLKHILALDLVEHKRYVSVDDLQKLKDNNALLVAPHAFIPHPSSITLGFFKQNHKLFTALEHMSFYSRILFNFNKKVHRHAKNFNKSIICNSDSHTLSSLNKNYSFVDADKNKDSVLEAIRKNKIKIHSNPMPLSKFLNRALDSGLASIPHIYRHYSNKKHHNNPSD